ncbi:hypothetical protein [Pseudalkalibacillus sp. SCS-8]
MKVKQYEEKANKSMYSSNPHHKNKPTIETATNKKREFKQTFLNPC